MTISHARGFASLAFSALLFAAGSLAHATQIDLIGSAGSGKFGTQVAALPNGNFVVTDPYFSISVVATNVGAVYLYNGATRTVISTLGAIFSY